MNEAIESHSPVLILRNLEPFAIGGTRLCFIHPTDSSKCIKVLRDDRTPAKRREQTQGVKKFRSLKHWDDQRKEKLAYECLQRNASARVWQHIPMYFGTIATDLGLGIVTQVFRNYDATFPQNLDQAVPQGIDAPLRLAVETFIVWLKEELVITRDLLPHNIIAVRDSPSSCRLVIVDGLGNSEWIPVSTWSAWFARRKIQRKITKFKMRINQLQTS